ncbi:MAG: TetR/AcrR family transcriptional regulator [Anaerolineae bacterium]|nr:TetR/AcrR family transcriptional regulator [Anaerolineae bacterium]
MVDRRVKRTRQLLRDALMELILEKGYDAVTVQDVTDRANLGRATFYLHYRDKEDLLTTSLEEIYDDLVERMEPVSWERLLSNQQSPSKVAFEHAAENRDLYLVLLRGQGAGTLTLKIRQYLANTIQQQMQVLADDSTIPLELLSNHIAGSLVAMLSWWLENDTPHSADYMAQIFSQLVMSGVMSTLPTD